jgi:very-short-patch-repair endonuclease
MSRTELATTLPGPVDPQEVIRTRFGSGPFTVAQAEQVGLSHDQVQRLVRRGTLTSVLFGVYQVGSEALDIAGRARAAGLVLPKDGAIARRTAAWLFGVDPRSPAERRTAIDVECVVPEDRVPLRRNGLRCYRTDMSPADLMQIEGIACTTPTRTSADLLRWSSPPMSLAVSDAMAAAGLIDAEQVLAMLARWPGHRFVAQARGLAQWIEPRSESFGESWLRLRVLQAGFPRPTAQIAIQDDTGRTAYRLDLGWPDLKIGIEYDGEEFHSSRAQIESDQRRRDRLNTDFGWHVIGVGMGEVLGRSLRLESGVGELLGMEPKIHRRTW